MRIFSPSNPYWARQLRNPVGFLMMLAAPLVLLLLGRFGGSLGEQGTTLLLLGWTLTGILPVALNGRRDPAVESRWLSLPVGAGNRWLAAFVALFPVSLVASELLVLGLMLLGPSASLNPLLFSVSAVMAAVLVALGLAMAAWSRNDWRLAGWLGVVLAVCVWALLPGSHGVLAELSPTGQAKLAIQAFSSSSFNVIAALLKLGLEGLLFVIVGIAGYGRR